jgi:zinc protease
MQHEVQEIELAGGARLLTIQIPNTITYYWSSTFRAGYGYVEPRLYELPHLAEHLAFEGTKTYPDAQAFKVAVERDGTYFNASTGYDYVSYIYSGGRESWERILPINLSQIYEPRYDAGSIEQEKRVIEQEMSRKREDDAWRIGYLGLRQVLSDRNPDIDQRIANIAAIKRAELQAYHERCYGVANTVFTLAGDYSATELAAMVKRLEKQLAGRPSGKRQKPRPARFEQFGGSIGIHAPFHKQQSLFNLQFVVPGYEEAHYVGLKLIAVLLTGGLSARLQRKAREAGLTYGISAYAHAAQDYTQLTIRSQTSVDKLEALVRLACGELAVIGSGDYSDDELARAIGFYAGGLRRSYQTPASYAGWYSDRFMAGMPLESPSERIAAVEAAGRAEIAAAYERYIQPQNRALTVIGAGLVGREREFDAAIATV